MTTACNNFAPAAPAPAQRDDDSLEPCEFAFDGDDQGAGAGLDEGGLAAAPAIEPSEESGDGR